MVFDLHNDLLTVKPQSGKSPTSFNPNVIYAVWTTELKDPFSFIKSLIGFKQKSNAAILTAIEDLGFLSKGLNFFDYKDGLYSNPLMLIKQLKPVYASLTWNKENMFAGGADTDTGLSENGKKMIALLESADILLDTAHLNRIAFFQAAEVAKKPFICSHTCFNGVFSHRRNISDSQVKAIIEKGGLIGLCLVPKFMGKRRAAPDDVVRQIYYFTEKFGDNNLGIGTDFNGCKHPALKNYDGFNIVKEKLLKLGFTQKTIDKIFYKNVCDFLAQNKDKNDE